MYRIYCKNHFYARLLTRDQLKLKEAYCRGLKLDYEITFPDNTVLRCQFSTSHKMDNSAIDTNSLKLGFQPES